MWVGGGVVVVGRRGWSVWSRKGGGGGGGGDLFAVTGIGAGVASADYHGQRVYVRTSRTTLGIISDHLMIGFDLSCISLSIRRKQPATTVPLD